MFVWVAVELLQIDVIAMLVVGYRNLERKLKQIGGFERRPPRSITEE